MPAFDPLGLRGDQGVSADQYQNFRQSLVLISDRNLIGHVWRRVEKLGSHECFARSEVEK